MSTERACKQCLVVKPLEMFSLSKRGIDGRHSFCKACRNARNNLANKLRRKDAHVEPEIWPRDMTERVLDVSINSWPALASTNDNFMRWCV